MMFTSVPAPEHNDRDNRETRRTRQRTRRVPKIAKEIGEHRQPPVVLVLGAQGDGGINAGRATRGHERGDGRDDE